MNSAITFDNANRDEVIADSEGEGEDMGVVDTFGNGKDIGKEYVSSVSAFTVNKETPNRGNSSISEFTAGPSRRKLDDISPASAFKRQHVPSGIQGMEDTSFEGPFSIADRAKTRQRGQTKRKAPEAVADVIELTSEDDDDQAYKSSKLKAKAKAQPKRDAKRSTKEKESTETPQQAQDDTGKDVQRKPRPRPRPVVKRQRTDNNDSLPPHPYPFGQNQHPFLQGLVPPQPPPTPPPPSSQSHGVDLPIATSPPRAALYSQLPPSDPPNPTMTTAYNEDHFQPATGLPPITILQDAESDQDRRASSPSSLFSEAGAVSRRKRKKRTPHEPQDNMEVDELHPSSPVGAYMDPPRLDHPATRKLTPPPTFFAGSSSSVIGGHDLPYPPEPMQDLDVVDLSNLPPTIAPVVLEKPKLKPKKPKAKKKVVNDEADFDVNEPMPMMVLDEDDQDGDFNPTGEGGGKKAKGKGKGKAKEKKPRGKKAKVQVEVVIPTKPTGKGKQKQSKDDEVFKSNEFIEDSDGDDADPLRLVGTEDVVENDKRDKALPTIYIRSRPASVLPNQDEDPAPSAGSSKSAKVGAQREKSKPKPKKRKAAQDLDEGAVVPADEEPTTVNKPRKSRKKDATAQDEERIDHEPDLDPKPKSTKEKTTNKRRVIASDDDEEEGAVERSAVAEASIEKENESPPPPPRKVISTPRPPPSRAPSARPDGTTPLYSRYEVAPRRSGLSMTELIRRASSKPCSPFPASASTPSLKDKSKSKPSRTDSDAVGSPATSTPSHPAYSPYLKSSRRLLSRIAPLHPNRRTPPPPPPPPPPRKKTKKELEMEEKWEEELVDEVGGIEAFAAMDETERKELRRAKREREMCGYDD